MSSTNKNNKQSFPIKGVSYITIDGKKIPKICHYAMSKNGCQWDDCDFMHTIKACAWCMAGKCKYVNCLANEANPQKTSTPNVYSCYDSNGKELKFYFDKTKYRYNEIPEENPQEPKPAKINSNHLNVYADPALLPKDFPAPKVVPAKPAEVKKAAPAKPAEVKKAAPAKPAEVKKATPAKPAEVKKAAPAPAKPAEVKKAAPAPAKPAEVKKAAPAPAPAPAYYDNTQSPRNSPGSEQLDAILVYIIQLLSTAGTFANSNNPANAAHTLDELNQYLANLQKYAVNIGNICAVSQQLTLEVGYNNTSVSSVQEAVQKLGNIVRY